MTKCFLRSMAVALLMLGAVAATGCQALVGDQVLPSGNYMKDDVNYHAPGLEHQFPLESAALREASNG